MIVDDAMIEGVVRVSLGDREKLSSAILKALQDTMYSNRMRVSPRRINEVSQEQTENFMEFVVTGDTNAVQARGQHLAREGLGQKAAVQIASAVRGVGLELAQRHTDIFEITAVFESYTNALLDGYMAAYEEELRREQQLTHEAYVRSVSNA